MGKNETSYIVLDDKHVEGDSIRCPYHGWRFGPDGKCDDIPYSPGAIPKAACVQSWPVQEHAGIVFIWHDPENGDPDYDLPPIPEWDDKAWVHWEVDHLGMLPCHPQEIVDNIVDKGHLAPIHGSTEMESFESVFEDHVARQKLAAGHRTLSEGMLYNDTWYTGPGILMSRMEGQHPSIMLICHTPVDDGSLMAWHALLVRSKKDVADEADVAMAREYQQASKLAFAQDFDVWSTKAPCINIMQVKGDGPFHKARQWYKQFFYPRARTAELQAKSNCIIVGQGTTRDPWSEND